MTREREMLIHIIDIVLRPEQFLNESLVNVFDIVHVLFGLRLPWQDHSWLGVFWRVIRGEDIFFVDLLISIALHVNRGHHRRGRSQVERIRIGVITPRGRGADFFDEELDLFSQLRVVFNSVRRLRRSIFPFDRMRFWLSRPPWM